MAIIINHVPEEWIDFIPEWNNNKSEPKKDQICCNIKPLTQKDSDRITDEFISHAQTGKKGIKKARWSKINKKITNEHVKDIKNVFLLVDGEKKELKTMNELYDIPQLKGLYQEIANALDISESLDDETKKN